MSEMQNYLQGLLPSGLRSMMIKATDVYHWNQLREIAKSEFPLEAIFLLDASGYIIQALKSTKRLAA